MQSAIIHTLNATSVSPCVNNDSSAVGESRYTPQHVYSLASVLHPLHSKILFHLSTTGQPFLHTIPAAVSETWQDGAQEPISLDYSFGHPTSISAWLNELEAVDTPSRPTTAGYSKRKGPLKKPVAPDPLYGSAANALRNFVAHWLKASSSRHHTGTPAARKGDMTRLPTSPLPNAVQFASMLVVLNDILLRGPSNIGSKSAWRASLIHHYPGAKNIIQQIDAVLRKKIRNIVEIERVFSKR